MHADNTAPAPPPRQRRHRHRVTRKLGALSAPAALLAACLAMAGAYLWGVSEGMVQLGAEEDEPFIFSFAHKAALLGFPMLTPPVLIAVHRQHWRLMRPWLKGAARGVLALWALAAALMAYALL